MSAALLPSETFRPYRSFVFPLLFLLAGICIYAFTLKQAYRIRGHFVTETVSEFGQLPSPGVQAASLEFKGVVSDYLFFKTMTYMGIKIGEKQVPSADEWQTMVRMLQRVTDLDPRFWDPYVFAEMVLGWQAGMFDEADMLLEKAAKNRPWDYRPQFYIGFNYLYFKKDSKNAAPHLRIAAENPNAPSYLKGLAARVSLYAGETGIGILFLENLIRETHDPNMLKYLEKRLTALKRMFFLEQKVKEYKEKNGRPPASLDDLVASGIIPEIPEDPYGGKFILLQNGRVYTTSEMVEK